MAAENDSSGIQCEVIHNEWRAFDEIDFDKLYPVLQKNGLVTNFDVIRVILSKRMCDRMSSFLEMIVVKDNYFEPLLNSLTEIGEQELSNRLWQRYEILLLHKSKKSIFIDLY